MNTLQQNHRISVDDSGSLNEFFYSYLLSIYLPICLFSASLASLIVPVLNIPPAAAMGYGDQVKSQIMVE
ncbi:MAG: hypothetical protein AAFZ92_01420 [Pseudomonadota bacterium]